MVQGFVLMAGSKHIPQQKAARLSRGKGQRDIDCPRYDECLSFAAKQDWPSFNCECCSEYKSKGLDRPKAGKPEKKAPKAQPGKINATVTIDFTEHPEAIKIIKKLAKKSGRSLETELMVMILVDLAQKEPDFYKILKYKAK